MFTLLRLNGSCSGLTMIRGVGTCQRAYTTQSGLLPNTEQFIEWIFWTNLFCELILMIWFFQMDFFFWLVCSSSGMCSLPSTVQPLVVSTRGVWCFCLFRHASDTRLPPALLCGQNQNQYPTTVWLHFESNTDWVKKQNQRHLFLSRKIC